MEGSDISCSLKLFVDGSCSHVRAKNKQSVQATSDNAKGVDISYHEPNGTVKEMKSSLIYGLNDKPPVKDAFFAALQHLLAFLVAIVTPPLSLQVP